MVFASSMMGIYLIWYWRINYLFKKVICMKDNNNLENKYSALPDIIKEELDILFVGYNPGKQSAIAGHHYAGSSNRFWKLLFESGLTPYKMSPNEDIKLLEFGYGSTNLVPRMTRSASEITPAEFREGSLVLEKLIKRIRPKVVCFVGIGVYRAFASNLLGIPERKINIVTGEQGESLIAGVIDFVCSNPSGLNVIPYRCQLECFVNLRKLVNTRFRGIVNGS